MKESLVLVGKRVEGEKGVLRSVVVRYFRPYRDRLD